LISSSVTGSAATVLVVENAIEVAPKALVTNFNGLTPPTMRSSGRYITAM